MQGDVEQVQFVDRIDGLQDSLHLFIHRSSSYNIHYGSQPAIPFEECQAYFAPSKKLGWMEDRAEDFELEETNVEIFRNGRHIEKIPLK